MKHLVNQKGVALVEVMISAIIGLVIFMAAADLISMQVLSLSRLRSKLELSGIQIDIQKALADPDTCMANFGMIRIDESSINLSDYNIPVPRLVDDSTTPNIIVDTGTMVTPPAIRVAFIRARNFVQVSPDEFRFDVAIPVSENGQFVTKMMNVHRIWMQVSGGPPNARIPVSCALGTGAPAVRACRIVEALGTANVEGQAFCAAGEELITGGGACVSLSGTDWIDTPIANDEYGYLVRGERTLAGSTQGWISDCLLHTPDKSRSKSVAYCCTR